MKAFIAPRFNFSTGKPIQSSDVLLRSKSFPRSVHIAVNRLLASVYWSVVYGPSSGDFLSLVGISLIVSRMVMPLIFCRRGETLPTLVLDDIAYDFPFRQLTCMSFFSNRLNHTTSLANQPSLCHSCHYCSYCIVGYSLGRITYNPSELVDCNSRPRRPVSQSFNQSVSVQT